MNCGRFLRPGALGRLRRSRSSGEKNGAEEMFDFKEINETVNMIERQHLDIRTITMGISLFDCAREDITQACRAVYDLSLIHI